MNLLIVDDEVPILNALKRSITSENPDIDITVCSTVSGVKELLFKNKFDCIVSDLNMPEEDGLSLIKYMKDESIEIPLIIMTGCPKTESAVECMKSGAVDFVSKPVSTSELITKVNDYCLSGHKKWSKGYTIKDYAVKELISETASSLVFTARKKDSEDTFVIKALKKDGIEFNDIELKRFQIEIDILRKLRADELKSGMIAAEKIITGSGSVIMEKGEQLTETHVSTLQIFTSKSILQEPFKMLVQ